MHKWTKDDELQCFLIYKKLENDKFPRGLQQQLCEKLAAINGISVGSLSAKVVNYKSEFKVNNSSNSSKATIDIVEKFGHLTYQQTIDLLKNKGIETSFIEPV